MVEGSTLKSLRATLFVCSTFLAFSCSKQEIINTDKDILADTTILQTDFFARIKTGLKDSLSGNDFLALDFDSMYKSKDVRTPLYFLRLGFKEKPIANDFILLKTGAFQIFAIYAAAGFTNSFLMRATIFDH